MSIQIHKYAARNSYLRIPHYDWKFRKFILKKNTQLNKTRAIPSNVSSCFKCNCNLPYILSVTVIPFAQRPNTSAASFLLRHQTSFNIV